MGAKSWFRAGLVSTHMHANHVRRFSTCIQGWRKKLVEAGFQELVSSFWLLVEKFGSMRRPPAGGSERCILHTGIAGSCRILKND